jgi:hypothetical protein
MLATNYQIRIQVSIDLFICRPDIYHNALLLVNGVLCVIFCLISIDIKSIGVSSQLFMPSQLPSFSFGEYVYHTGIRYHLQGL